MCLCNGAPGALNPDPQDRDNEAGPEQRGQSCDDDRDDDDDGGGDDDDDDDNQ